MPAAGPVPASFARDIGAAWLCLQAIRQIGLDRFLSSLGWPEEQVKLSIAHLIVRTIYTPSELKSIHTMRDNSGVCELLDLDIGTLTQRKVYGVADNLFREKMKIEKYLCQTTDDLFKPTDRVVLFDLANSFWEGRKDGSMKAQFGRSKEKGSDCKLLVLALAINTDGFIRYSAVLEGNTADPKSLPDMVDKLIVANPANMPDDQKVLVVIDAGIASQENLDLIKAKGYRSTSGRLACPLPVRVTQGADRVRGEAGCEDCHGERLPRASHQAPGGTYEG